MATPSREKPKEEEEEEEECCSVYLCFSTYVPRKILEKIFWGRRIVRFLHVKYEIFGAKKGFYLKRTDFGKEIYKRDHEFR